MGMAASQARLLTITARLADNELRSQTINNAKMRLASESSQASENYINALNNATMKFSNYDATGAAVTQDLTYNALTAYSSYNTQYGLTNSAGQILVSEQEAAMFAKANGNLNAYLQQHGLEYTTTYFDELGDMTNPTYPAPFNIVSADQMQSYYEAYGSYQNSVEVERYEKYYNEYLIASENLNKAAKDCMVSYLTSSSNPKLNVVPSTSGGRDQYQLALSGTTMSGLLNEFKTAFTGNGSSNTYNINNLHANGFISEVAKDDIEKLINAYSITNVTVTNSDGTTGTRQALKYTEQVGISVGEADASGNKIYTLDGDIKVTVDAAGNVINVDASQAVSNNADTGTLTVDYPKKNDGTIDSQPFASFVNQMSYTMTETDDGGATKSYTYNYKLGNDADGNYTLTSSTVFSDLNEVKTSILPSLSNAIVSRILNYANYENFSQYLIDQDRTSLFTKYGINISSYIKGTEKTLEDILDDFLNAKSSFFGNIFSPSSLSTVEDDLKNGYAVQTDVDADGNPVMSVVTAENLTDIDFVLKYINDSQQRVLDGTLAQPIVQSDSFNTVIKEYMIDLMIEQTGEPKYAWVDQNDTGNTGNADAKAQWYTNLFKRMTEGYKALENGLASSKEWIEYALETGIVRLEQVDKSFKWNALDYKACTRITEETDQDAVTKAEAEYNRAMKDIEAKDNVYDIELKNIDTEHTSLQTEYDSIKGVISKNIERTFKFSQNA